MNSPAAQRIAAIRGLNISELAHAGCIAESLKLPLEVVIQPEPLQVRDLLEVIDHVKDVLEEAERNNGGYGFVRMLLEYLG